MDYSKHTKLSMKDKMAAGELGRARNYGLDDPSVCEGKPTADQHAFQRCKQED